MPRKPRQKIETVSADAFKTEGGRYVFPFVLLDPTPGGSNLGRIGFDIEFVPTKNKKAIGKILLHVNQTRDERYAGKVFEIEANTATIFGCSGTLIRDGRTRMTIFVGTWMLGICREHNAPFLRVHPSDGHTRLVIEPPFSSIGSDIFFE